MNRDKSIMAIHIDDDSLNIVHLRQTANALQVQDWTAVPLEQGIIVDGIIVDVQTIAQEIRTFIKAAKLKTNKTVISLPCSSVRLKPAELEGKTDEDLKKQVEDQIAKYVLFARQEVVFDYYTSKKATASNKQAVLQAVTTRKASDACLEVLKRNKLNLLRIAPAVPAISALIYDKQTNSSEPVSLLLTMDAALSNLSIFNDGVLKFSQNLNFGVRDISQQENNIAKLTDQMQSVLEFARTMAGPQKLVLRIAANYKNKQTETIASQIEQGLNDITVEKIDSSKIAAKFGVKNANDTDIPIFALASALTALDIGNSTGKLNLVSQESLAKQKTHKEMSLTAQSIIAVVLLFVALIVPLKTKVQHVRAAAVQIEKKAAEVIPVKREISGLNKRIETLKKEQLVYGTLDGAMVVIPWAKALRVIADVVPNSVRIISISTTNSAECVITGEARTENRVYRFAKKLQNKEFVKSAEVEGIEYENTEENIVNYRIIFKIKLPEEK